MSGEQNPNGWLQDLCSPLIAQATAQPVQRSKKTLGRIAAERAYGPRGISAKTAV